MTKKYPIILYPVEENGIKNYSVLVPDFPGCVSQGDSEQDALENARSALDLHIQALVEGEQDIPEPSTVDQIVDKSEPLAIYGLIEIPLSELRERALARKSVRINVTFPGHLLQEIDAHCERTGVARSKLFQQLAERFLSGRADYQHGYTAYFDDVFRKVFDATSKKYYPCDVYKPVHETMERSFSHEPVYPGAEIQSLVNDMKPQSQSLFAFVCLLYEAFWTIEKQRASGVPSKSDQVTPFEKR